MPDNLSDEILNERIRRLVEIMEGLKDIWLWLHTVGKYVPWPPPGDPVATKKFRRALLENQRLLEDLSESVDKVLRKYDIKLEKEMSYAFVPVIFERPVMVHEISDWCSAKANMVAILEPDLIKTLGKYRIQKGVNYQEIGIKLHGQN